MKSLSIKEKLFVHSSVKIVIFSPRQLFSNTQVLIPTCRWESRLKWPYQIQIVTRSFSHSEHWSNFPRNRSFVCLSFHERRTILGQNYWNKKIPNTFSLAWCIQLLWRIVHEIPYFQDILHSVWVLNQLSVWKISYS